MENTNQLYDQLIFKKYELTQKLQEIIEISEGKENPEVAKKITRLETEKLETEKKIQILTTEKDHLKTKSDILQNEINNMSGQGIQRILDAIKKQRWFYFKDKPKVIFDKTTAYLWPNFVYFKVEENEVSTILSLLSNCAIDNFTKWSLPSIDEYKSINGMPDKGNYNVLSDKTSYNNYHGTSYHDTMDDKKSVNYKSSFYPVNRTLSNSNFPNDVKPDNKIYSDDEKAKMVLDIFVNNKFRVLFDEEGITDLYNKLFFDKEELIKQMQEIEEQIAKLPKPCETIVDFISFQELIRDFDLTEIKNSKLQYCHALLRWFNLLIGKLDDFKMQYQELLLSADNYEKRIFDSCVDGDHQLIHQRTKYLSENLNFGLESLSSDLLAFKKEAMTLRDELNNSKNLQAICDFNKKELPDFYLVAEKTSVMFAEQLLKIEMYRNNQEIFNQIADVHEKWRNNLREFLNVTKEHFHKLCKKNHIEDEHFNKWYDEWSAEWLSVENHIEPLIKAGIDKIIPFKEIIRISDLISQYITDEYGKFYFEQLIPMHQKYAFDEKLGALHLTLEKENLIQNIQSNFRSKIEDVIFDLETNEARLFIVRWAQDWYEEQIEHIVTFTSNKNLSDIIAKDTLQSLKELKQKNFEAFLLDKTAYAEANKNMTEEFNALMFKMRKEAQKK